MRLDDNLSHFTLMTSNLLKPHYQMSLLCACVCERGRKGGGNTELRNDFLLIFMVFYEG